MRKDVGLFLVPLDGSSSLSDSHFGRRQGLPQSYKSSYPSSFHDVNSVYLSILTETITINCLSVELLISTLTEAFDRNDH